MVLEVIDEVDSRNNSSYREEGSVISSVEGFLFSPTEKLGHSLSSSSLGSSDLSLVDENKFILKQPSHDEDKQQQEKQKEQEKESRDGEGDDHAAFHESPRTQTMDQSGSCIDDLQRIPSPVRSKSVNRRQWSIASSESLFSLQLGNNNSFSAKDQVILFGDLVMSGELNKSGELVVFGTPSPSLYPVGEITDTNKSIELMGRKEENSGTDHHSVQPLYKAQPHTVATKTPALKRWFPCFSWFSCSFSCPCPCPC